MINAWLVHAYTASGLVLALLATRAGKDCFEHRTQAVHCGGARAPYRCASHLSAHLTMLIKAALSRRNDMNADGKKFVAMRANRSARLLQNTCTVPEEARAQMSCIRNGGPRARASNGFVVVNLTGGNTL